MSNPPEPKLFVSYSWSSPDHEAWVLKLAEELTSQGIHVILDKWDLQPGHDANAFMEGMVTDPTVTKVILVCDQKYAQKSNNRSGGAGTEAQIITPELYAKKAQDKFVAVSSATTLYVLLATVEDFAGRPAEARLLVESLRRKSPDFTLADVRAPLSRDGEPRANALGAEGCKAARIGSGRLGEPCVRNQPFSHDQPVRRARNNVQPSVRRDLEISRNPASVIHARY